MAVFVGDAQTIGCVLQARAQRAGRKGVVGIGDVLAEDLIQELVQGKQNVGLFAGQSCSNSLEVQPVLKYLLLKNVQFRSVFLFGPVVGYFRVVGGKPCLEILADLGLAAGKNKPHVLQPGDFPHLCGILEFLLDHLPGGIQKVGQKPLQQPYRVLLVQTLQAIHCCLVRKYSSPAEYLLRRAEVGKHAGRGFGR